MRRYKIIVDIDVEIPSDFEKHINWAFQDVLGCSKDYVKVDLQEI